MRTIQEASWTRSNRAEVGELETGQRTKREGSSDVVVKVPESRFPSEDLGKPNILSLTLAALSASKPSSAGPIPLHPLSSKAAPISDMGAENAQPGPVAKVSEVMATYRPTRVSGPLGALMHLSPTSTLTHLASSSKPPTCTTHRSTSTQQANCFSSLVPTILSISTTQRLEPTQKNSSHKSTAAPLPALHITHNPSSTPRPSSTMISDTFPLMTIPTFATSRATQTRSPPSSSALAMTPSSLPHSTTR